MNWTNVTYYEQPATELIRTCLRLEHLFAKLDQFIAAESDFHTRMALQALLEIASVVDRHDLKALLSKELTRHAYNFMKLEQLPNVDHEKLQNILKDIKGLNDYLNEFSGKFAQNIRQNDFLNTIRLHLNNPGGSLNFDNPAYHYWLQQSYQTRFHDLQYWLEDLTLLNRSISLVLQLLRECSVPEYKTAHEGFYQDALDAKQLCQLIRVGLPHDANVFPEISVGRHRICVRFCNPTNNEKSKQTSNDILFALTCCVF